MSDYAKGLDKVIKGLYGDRKLSVNEFDAINGTYSVALQNNFSIEECYDWIAEVMEIRGECFDEAEMRLCMNGDKYSPGLIAVCDIMNSPQKKRENSGKK